MKIMLWFERVLGRLIPSPDRIVPLIPNSVEVFNKSHALIARHRPDLAAEFLGLRYMSMGATARWLNEHLPVPGGWGIRLCWRLDLDLRELLEPSE